MIMIQKVLYQFVYKRTYGFTWASTFGSVYRDSQPEVIVIGAPFDQ